MGKNRVTHVIIDGSVTIDHFLPEFVGILAADCPGGIDNIEETRQGSGLVDKCACI